MPIFTSPISLAFIVLTVVMMVIAFMTEKKEAQKAAKSTAL
ncbi:MAG: hypothetical protein AB7G87_12580 [Clostridia bacterium]